MELRSVVRQEQNVGTQVNTGGNHPLPLREGSVSTEQGPKARELSGNDKRGTIWVTCRDRINLGTFVGAEHVETYSVADQLSIASRNFTFDVTSLGEPAHFT